MSADKRCSGAVLSTFTFRLPFVLGVSDNFAQEISLPADYANDGDARTFASPPFVRLRLYNATVLDRKFSLANAPAAVRHFYNAAYDPGPADDLDHHLYEQWASLETPEALLTGEDSADGTYMFHRCLFALNAYLQAFALARSDNRVRPISSRELRPVVIVGSLALDGEWTLSSPMLMHPNATARPLSSRSLTEHAESLNAAMETLLQGNPFVPSWQWKARAERRRYEGDNADAVVSFQIAAEVLLFELWALLLADDGYSTEQIADLQRNTSFAKLVKTELSQRLGGSWDTTRARTPVHRYWEHLYALRIQVVHAGYLPNDGDADEAEQAFEGLRTFLDERLEMKAERYPSAADAMKRLAKATATN